MRIRDWSATARMPKCGVPRQFAELYTSQCTTHADRPRERCQDAKFCTLTRRTPHGRNRRSAEKNHDRSVGTRSKPKAPAAAQSRMCLDEELATRLG